MPYFHLFFQSSLFLAFNYLMLTDVFQQWVTIFYPSHFFGVLTAGTVSSTSWLRRIHLHLPGRTTGYDICPSPVLTLLQMVTAVYLVCRVKRLPRSLKWEPPTYIVAKVPVHHELPFVMHLVVIDLPRVHILKNVYKVCCMTHLVDPLTPFEDNFVSCKDLLWCEPHLDLNLIWVTSKF